MTDINHITNQAARNVAHIRAVADFLETRPLIASRLSWMVGAVNVFARNEEDWDAMRRELGSYDKQTGSYYLAARRRIADGLTIDVNIERENVCRTVKVGEREVEVEEYPEDVTPTIVTKVEDVFEWGCPPSWGDK